MEVDVAESLSFMIDLEPDLNESDLADLLQREDICSQALQSFLAFKITFDDFIDIVESQGIDIDEYLNNSGYNIGLW
jgi:hypothetical protein